MYISNHEQFTSRVSHNRKAFIQSNGLMNRTSLNSARRALARVAMLVILLTLGASCGAIVHAYAAQDQVTVNEFAGNSGLSAEQSKDQGNRISSEQVTIVVYSGDSLWSIAKEHAPKGTDVRSYISQIERLNNLKSTHLTEGQALKLPNN